MFTYRFTRDGRKMKVSLPEILRFSDGKSFGQDFFYNVLGYRKPKKDEWYVPIVPEAYEAPNDLSQEYIVVEKRARAIQKIQWVEMPL